MVKRAGFNPTRSEFYKMKLILILFPILLYAQEWVFDVDSLKDDEPESPMILYPFIDGYTPIIDYNKVNQEDKSGKVYNGFQVQVVSFDNMIDADSLRFYLSEQIPDTVEVVFDAPNYKVRAGAFTDRMDAEELRRKLYRLGYRRSWIVRARLTY